MRRNPLNSHCLVGALCVIGLALAMAWGVSSREPSYKGRSLAYWFHELPVTMSPRGPFDFVYVGVWKYGALREKPSASIAAFRSMGPRALPFVMRKLGTGQKPVRALVCIDYLAFKCGAKQPVFYNPVVEQAQAITALLSIEPLPPEVLLQLRNLSSAGTNSTALAATFILSARTNATLLAQYQAVAASNGITNGLSR